MNLNEPLKPIQENFPAMLLPFKRWCVWKLENRDGKPTKVPYTSQASKGRSNDFSTWLSYQEADDLFKSGVFSGFGIYTGQIGDSGDDLIGCDWDHTATKEMWGVDEPEVVSEALAIGSYCERSPSGTGLRVFALLKDIPDKVRKGGPREVYQDGRFLTITGHRIDGSPLDVGPADPDGFSAFYQALVSSQKSKKKTVSSSPKLKSETNRKQQHTTQAEAEKDNIRIPDPDLDAETVLKLAEKNYKDKFRDARDTNLTGGHVSETDLTFCNYVAPYCSGVHQIAQLLQTCRQREKTLERQDYLIRTATRAWEDRTLYFNKELNRLSYINSFIEKESPPSLKKYDDTAPKSDTHIEILENEPPDVQMEKTLAALHVKNDPPVLFVRAGQMVRIISDERRYPAIDPVTEVSLRTKLYECVDFIRLRPDKDGNLIKKRVRPSIDCLRDIMASRGWVDLLPPLVGLTNTPLIHLDGDIISQEGYDSKTALYYQPEHDLQIPPIPLEPNQKDVAKAVKILWEPFKEFKFVDIADGTHILSGLISIVCRNLIDGNVPMLVIDKPTPGTGASLISQIIGLISEGRDPHTTTQPKTEDEWRKQILSFLGAGRPSIVVDNIEGRLKSPSLAALLTTREYSDRKLGTSDNMTLHHHIVWIGNGNNVSLGGDLPRRVYWSRMDSESVRPWTDDKKYEHPDIRKWTSDHRGEIIAAILTLSRAWIQAKRPKPDNTIPKLGGFEAWRDVVGGILCNAGIPGFLGNIQKMYEISDTEVPQWDRFFEAWFHRFGDGGITTKDLQNEIMCSYEIKIENETLTLRDVLPDQFLDIYDKSGSFSRMMGHALSKRRDRRYPSGYKITQDGEIRRAMRWKVVKTETQSTILT